MKKIIVQGYILVPATILSDIEQELPVHIKNTRQETGCLTFEVTQNINQTTRFEVYEEFENQQAFDLHQNRVNISRWGELAKDAERHYTIREQ